MHQTATCVTIIFSKHRLVFFQMYLVHSQSQSERNLSQKINYHSYLMNNYILLFMTHLERHLPTFVSPFLIDSQVFAQTRAQPQCRF